MASSVASAGGSTTPSADAPETPAHLGRYRLDERVGVGHFTEVFRAFDPRLGRTVAVRWCRRGDARERAHFVRAMQRWSDLDLAGVPRLLDLEDDGVSPPPDGSMPGADESPGPYAVLEWCEARSLADILARGTLAPDQVVAIVQALADTVIALHERGLAHGAIAPSHVLIGMDGAHLPRVQLFGPSPGAAHWGPDDAERWCRAPEQSDGLAPTAASDVFALAALAYAANVGHAPFAPQPDGAGNLELPTAEHWLRDLASFRAVGREAIVQSLSARPADRPTDPEALVNALRGSFRDSTRPGDSGRPPTSTIPVVAARMPIANPSADPAITRDHPPRGRSGSSRRLALTGAAALAVLAIIGLMGFGSGGATAVGSTSATTTAARRVTTTTLSAASAVVEFVPHELRANCVVGDAAPSESAVRCSEGPTSVIYRQRVPGAELGSAVRAAATVSGACTGHPPGDQPWTARQGDAAAGTIRVACAGAHVQIVWTNTRVNIVARADRTDGNVAALWTWWQAHGGPLERAAP